jgi:hypothetical protein
LPEKVEIISTAGPLTGGNDLVEERIAKKCEMLE